jgi:hypothetical protein
VQQKEPAPPQTGRIRLDHTERGRDGHRGIEGIASLLQDFVSGRGGERMGGGDGRRAGLGRDADDEEEQRDKRDAGARACARKQGLGGLRRRWDRSGA